MATKYRKADNCGPVPYPDRSGKFLNHGEVAEGDDWAPFVALGYVVPVDAAAAPVEIEEPKAAILKEDAQGVSDVVQQPNDGVGAEEMDPSEAGKSSDEGLSGRAPSRRCR
jgi:hypothetical protein